MLTQQDIQIIREIVMTSHTVLKTDIRELRTELIARIENVEVEMKQVKQEVSEVKKEISDVKIDMKYLVKAENFNTITDEILELLHFSAMSYESRLHDHEERLENLEAFRD